MVYSFIVFPKPIKVYQGDESIDRMVKSSELSIYLHIPFCRHRCSYCDFNTYAGISELIPAYMQAISREIQLLGESAGTRLPVRTVYFGGGTPSLVPLPELDKVLVTLDNYFDLLPGAEISLEANPGTVSLGYLKDLSIVGVNRLSLGMQSAVPKELRLLEREHDFAQVIQAVNWARKAAFDNLNLDLIFGIPNQTQLTWQGTLHHALALQPDHFSLYALSIEQGTPMHAQVERKLIPVPDPDLAADLYEYAAEQLEQAGYQQYEISNWARLAADDKAITCRHNLQYWRNLSYLGLGAGAHGYAGGIRTANVLAPALYIERVLAGQVRAFPLTPATDESIQVGRSAEIAETMMMGLRLVQEGVSHITFQERFGEDLRSVFGEKIGRLCALGLLEWAGSDADILRLTPRGRLLGNQVFVEFI